jgi:phage terminase large subunit
MQGYGITSATMKVINLTKRIRGISGGTSAGKTIAILQDLIDLAQRDPAPTLTSITSETYPHLRRGAMRDFQLILDKQGYWRPRAWNAENSTYTFETGSVIEFFSLDAPRKTRGPRRDRLFINEGNTIPFETFEQLEVRTKELVYIDWNPTHEFWWYTEVAPKRDHDFLILTYKDNESLDPEIVASIESRKSNTAWWRVYGEGQLGTVDERIYTNWELIDQIPEHARLVRYGLDFGYSVDPTTVIAVYEYQHGFILDEVVYEKRLLNKDIADRMRDKPEALIVADSAEPKSIDELRLHGLDVIGATKGKDSIAWGISQVQKQKIWITKQSTNTLKEYRSYLWRKDKDGKMINHPTAYLNHALDAIRYAISDILPDIESDPVSEPIQRPVPTYGHNTQEDEEEGNVYVSIDYADVF